MFDTIRKNQLTNCTYPANTKHLYNICTSLDQRLRRWSNDVQMLYKCFVFAGYPPYVDSILGQCRIMTVILSCFLVSCIAQLLIRVVVINGKKRPAV